MNSELFKKIDEKVAVIMAKMPINHTSQNGKGGVAQSMQGRRLAIGLQTHRSPI